MHWRPSAVPGRVLPVRLNSFPICTTSRIRVRVDWTSSSTSCSRPPCTANKERPPNAFRARPSGTVLAPRAPPQRPSAHALQPQYWTIAQMVTHHTEGGCNLQAGDLLGSGTISGPQQGEAGAMIELTENGRKAIRLYTGE